MKTLAIGIDIGGTRTKIGLVNLDTGQTECRPLDAIRIMPTETKDENQFLQLIDEAIRQLKEKATLEQNVLVGVGIGVPGFVFANGIVPDCRNYFLPKTSGVPPWPVSKS